MRNAPELFELGSDERGEDRFTTREMVEAEQRLHRAAELIAEKERHEVGEREREAALARAEARGLVLSGEQADALAHVTDGRDLGMVVGYAGTGKSAMLGVAREAWEVSGFEVRGVALSDENLESGSGIASRTIASMEHGWGQGRDMLTSHDVLVIDEAGAKVVLVGDPQQLQSIEAGAAFRSIHERHGGAEIGEVRRQREDWQRDATRDLATGRTGAAIHVYDRHDMVHEAQTREQARDELIDRWDRDRQAAPDSSRIILTHTNAEVRELNEAARDRMREAGDLGEDVRVTVERGDRNFATGDRVMFLQNERGLGFKNGTHGTIEQVSTQSITVQTDDGRSIAFDLKDYDRIDHGYAATIHKAQGMTVYRTHVLATPGLDAHGSYVALSRHRGGMDLHYGRDDFASQVPEKVRSMFDGLCLPADGAPGANAGERPERGRADADGPQREPASPARADADDLELAMRRARTDALKRHARAVDGMFSTEDTGGKASPEQVRELTDACKAFEEVRPHGWRDAEAAYVKDPELAREAGSGRVNRAIRALQLETETRTDPQRRADRFVERWQKLDRASQHQYQAGDMSGKASGTARFPLSAIAQSPPSSAEPRPRRSWKSTRSTPTRCG